MQTHAVKMAQLRVALKIRQLCSAATDIISFTVRRLPPRPAQRPQPVERAHSSGLPRQGGNHDTRTSPESERKPNPQRRRMFALLAKSWRRCDITHYVAQLLFASGACTTS